MGALQCGPCGQWSTQNFGWVGYSAFGPTNNWPVCLLILGVVDKFSGKLVKLVPPDVIFEG